MIKFYPLRIKNIIRETVDAVSLVFDVPTDLAKEFQFKPGQYLTLKTKIQGEELRRSYSISSAPYENTLQVSVKKVEQGKFSTFANEQLKEGDSLELMIPEGNFTPVLSPTTQKHYILFASGSGITPILSILKAVLHTEPKSQVTLIYGNKTIDSMMFKETLEDLKNTYLDRLSFFPIFSREVLGNELFKGRIDEAKCSALCKTVLDLKHADVFFICGPYDMMTSVKSFLLKEGVDKAKIHVELFGTPTPAELSETSKAPTKPDEKKTFNTTAVEIIMDGDSMKFNMPVTNKSILDFAYDLGYDLPYSCKGGVCCTCKAKLLEGKASMRLNYSLEEDEIAAGYILMCQSKPESDHVVISFDE